jgi:hypothetical protein
MDADVGDPSDPKVSAESLVGAGDAGAPEFGVEAPVLLPYRYERMEKPLFVGVDTTTWLRSFGGSGLISSIG